MWQCKECGKKFNIEPIYCDFCGASEGFLEQVDQAAEDDFYKQVENSFNTSVQAKSFHDYDSLIKDFMADEYIPVSTKVKEPFEDEERLRKEKAEKEKKLKSLDDDYYESIKSVVGAESLENDDYYKDLETMFNEPINSGDQTTFNGIFKKEDTIENTFLKPKKKAKRVIKSPIAADVPKAAAGKGLRIPIPAIPLPGKKTEGGGKPARPSNPKDDKKLLKLLGGLGAVFVVMVVLMLTLVNYIVDSGDNADKLPSETNIMSFFTQVKALDEQAFMSNPTMVSFYNYSGTIDEKQTMLKNLYALVTAADVEVRGTKDIVQKGINRFQVDFDVKGSELAVSTLDQLLFRTNDNKTYQLDFSDFVNQYTIASKDAEPTQ